ncbi:hypothetical protein ACJIZ3_008326 [Penstemon smallii]|uniref:Pre-mRNA-processing factor 39 n=1 Tax=Penstemon smallii TaxID=265156 RepID=A0ABD3TAN1_9LAMI
MSNINFLSVSLSEKLNKMIASNSLDYNSWRLLILEIDTASPDDIDTISLAYDSFLSKFPLCHWHLEKYAYHKAKLCGAQEAIKIFEQVAGAAMYSVGFWVDYFTFGTSCFGDPEDVRRLFGRALSCVGKDYFCHALWDKYMKYEFSQEGWSSLAQSYIQALRFPTKKLHFYYDNFKLFVANLEEEMGYDKNSIEIDQVSVPSAAIMMSRDEVSVVVKNLLDSSDISIKSKALDRYNSIGQGLYQEANRLDEKIKCFEKNIRRRYFHANPLDDDQLTNWHLYLDFMEKQDNLDLVVKLYERCLIPCANYPEFWMRYVEFLEFKRGHELCLSALDRATKIFVKNVPEIHLFNARLKERIGDVDGARAALLLYDTKSDSSFIENVVTQANMERRLGNFAAASAVYVKALKTATEKQKLHIIPSLYSHYARLTFMITGSADAARDVLIDGIRQVHSCRFLLEELIKFAMTHEGASQVNIVDSIVADAISPRLDAYEGLNSKDRESVSCLFLEFVDLCGTVHDYRKAWNRHITLFPQFLRLKPTYKQFTSGNYWLDGDRDQKGSYNLAVHNQPPKDQGSGNPSHLQVFDIPVNHEIHPPSKVLRKQSPQKAYTNNDKDTVQALSTEVVLSNKDASWLNEPAHDLSCQSIDDTQAMMDVSTKFANQSNKSALSPPRSAHEFGKSSITDETVEASHSSKMDVSQELDHEFKYKKQPVSLDIISLNSQEKDSGQLMPMSSDDHETKRNASAANESTPLGSSNVDFNSFAGTKSTQTFESSLLHDESKKEKSVNHLNNTKRKRHADPSRTGEDSIQIDHMVTAKHATSDFQEHVQDQDNLSQQSFLHHRNPADGLDSKMLMNQSVAQQNSTRQNSSQEQAVAGQGDTAANYPPPGSTMTPPSTTSVGQSPLSTPPVSHPQQQHPEQSHQNLSMDQMLQYHYHQQYFWQQQYQQQQAYLQMQHQSTNEQSHQLQPQQNQQHYVQQSQLQSLPYLMHHQQNQQIAGHLQSQQGQQPHLNIQHAHEKQYSQPQELAYYMQQVGYQQNAAQGQQFYLQQYQQYQQGYQQSQEGHLRSQEYLHQSSTKKQQDEQLQQRNQSRNQQDSKISPLDCDGASRPSESPHLQGQ